MKEQEILARVPFKELLHYTGIYRSLAFANYNQAIERGLSVNDSLIVAHAAVSSKVNAVIEIFETKEAAT